MRRLLGVAYNNPEHTGVAIRAYVERPGGFEHMAFYFKRQLLPAYGWIFPIDERGANVGVMIDAARFRRQARSLPELLRSFLRSSGHEDLEHNGPAPTCCRSPVTSRRWCMGGCTGWGRRVDDQPFSGEGIAYGMAAAWKRRPGRCGRCGQTRAVRRLRDSMRGFAGALGSTFGPLPGPSGWRSGPGLQTSACEPRDSGPNSCGKASSCW